MSFTLHGLGVSKGIAIGTVHIIARHEPEIKERPPLGLKSLEEEVVRFEAALSLARQQLYHIREQTDNHPSPDMMSFIDMHLMMLNDSMLTQAPIELIQRLRCTAEWALKLQKDRLVGMFEAMEDPYLRTRKEDVEHVVKRVLVILVGQSSGDHPDNLPKPNSIVLADDLSPADTLLIQHQGVSAFITEFGGPSSHTAIVARSLGIPAIVGLRWARHYIRHEDILVIDGYHGVVLVNPDKRSLRHYRTRQAEERRYRSELGKMRQTPAVTLDGIPISLHANIELPEDVDTLHRCGANGIGLYRTEFLYLNRNTLPDEAEQLEAYEKVIHALKGKPVTIRTLDLGTDKPLAGVLTGERAASPNPALGLRAIRMCLKEPNLFRPQLRAILRASRHGTVRLLLPMISSLQELFQIRQLISEIQQELQAEKLKFDPKLPVGVMVEVPSVAVCADLFAPHIDFMSIGTNDLIQYTLAIDRGDNEVTYLYDPLHPAVLRLLKMSIQAASKADKPISMCGEMAGDSRYVRLLLGLGLRSFSVNPESYLEVKKIINTTRISSLRRYSGRILKNGHPGQLADLLDKLNRGVKLN